MSPDPEKPRRTQEERSAATQKAILAAAADLLVEGGLGAVTIAGVSKAAGVSSGAVLHHYANKMQLIVALTSHLSDHAKDAVVMSTDPGASAAERVAVMVDTLMGVTHDERTRAQLELHTAARTDPALAEEMIVLNARSAENYVFELGRVFADSPVPVERKLAAMELAICAAIGHALFTITGSDPVIAERLADSLRRVVLAEIEAAEGSED